MLVRKICANHLRPEVRRTRVDLYPLPAVLPFRVGKKAIQRFDIKIALAFEVVVESAARQTRARHDLVKGYLLKAMAVKKPACALNDPAPDFNAVSFRIGHGIPHSYLSIPDL